MTTWKMDLSHSEVKFKVRHLVVSTVTGNFNSYDGAIETSKDDFSDAKISFEANIDSIDTNDKNRDGHLLSADFFDAAHHPKLTFVSKSFRKKSENDYELIGDITIRGTTKEIKLNVIYNGMAKGFGGVEVAGFEITGKLNRLDFGLHWSAVTEVGGIVLSDEVRLEIFAELKKVQLVPEQVKKEKLAAAE